MSKLFINYEQAIDDALRKACRILALLSAPAYFLGAYRSSIVEFAPVHLVTISYVWLSFFVLSMRTIQATSVRYNIVIINFLILFIAISFKNQSVIVSDVYLVVACALIAIR